MSMRCGILVSGLVGPAPSLSQVVNRTLAAEEKGLAVAWYTHVLSWDSLTMIAVAGSMTTRIELLAGVVPIYSRPPLVMAQQAVTANSASDGRLTLGIGLAHPETTTSYWGMPYDEPVQHMEEYLEALLPLLRGEEVCVRGRYVAVETALALPEPPVPRLVLGALGKSMLRLSRRATSGIVLWMTGPKAIRNYVVPTLARAAEPQHNDRFRIYAGLPICVTDETGKARRVAANAFNRYGKLRNYRRMLELEDASVADVAIIGHEDHVLARLEELQSGGVTDFLGAPFALASDDYESVPRTQSLLAAVTGGG